MSPEGPDRREAVEKYRRLASTYDRRVVERLVLNRTRDRVVELLDADPGWTVLDIACGTGLSLGRLVRAVGPTGVVIGIDQSPDMLSVARERIATKGWSNVRLVEAPVEKAAVGEPADGAILHLAHDVLRSRPALENIVNLLRPDGRIAVASARAAGWVPPRIARAIARPYVTTFEALDRPWTILAELVPNLRIEMMFRGCMFLACGSVSVV